MTPKIRRLQTRDLIVDCPMPAYQHIYQRLLYWFFREALAVPAVEEPSVSLQPTLLLLDDLGILDTAWFGPPAKAAAQDWQLYE